MKKQVYKVVTDEEGRKWRVPQDKVLKAFASPLKPKKSIKKMYKKKIIALFGYPIDNSVRAKTFKDMAGVQMEMETWKDICYFIVAFETNGKVFYSSESGLVMQ